MRNSVINISLFLNIKSNFYLPTGDKFVMQCQNKAIQKDVYIYHDIVFEASLFGNDNNDVKLSDYSMFIDFK